MGRKCSVKDCKSDSQRSEDVGVTFHKVPPNAELRAKWIGLCNIQDDKKVIYVCSRHFMRADFCSYKGRKYMLRQGVFPSIFPWSKSKIETKETVIIDKTKATTEPTVTETIKKTNEVKTTKNLDINTVPEEHNSSINEIIDSEVIPEPAISNTEIKVEMSNIMKPLHIKTDSTEIKDDLLSPSSTIEQNISSINTPTGELTFVPNARIEALDFNQVWRPASILEVDYEENEVLVHFDMYSSKYDEWIGINSHSIRALPVPGKNKIIQNDNEVTSFQVGERCMASWSDARKFAARITKILENNTYEVLFDDGYSKILKSHRISKCSGTSPPTSPLFHPVSSTKEERRNNKRKHTVKTLFSRKRAKPITGDSIGPGEPLLQEVDTKTNAEETDSWMPKWENQRPIGQDSYLFHSDGYRKSIIVSDPRLPENYKKHLVQRTLGQSTGKWDVVIVTPEDKKLRGKSEALKHIEENPQYNLKESMFDFAVHEKPRRRRRPQPLQTEVTLKQEIPATNNFSKQLKIQQEGDGYVCPIEGCRKKFRREHLTQMHVKHYHPQYTKFLDSTPNVADLAYARTVGENLDRSPGGPLKDNRVTKPINRVIGTTPSDSHNESVAAKQEQTKDMEIIRLLNSKPFDSLNIPAIEPLPSGLPPSMYPDFKLKDLLSKSEPVPRDKEINLKMACRSTGGIKTLLPVRRESAPKPNLLPEDFLKKNTVSEMFEPKIPIIEPKSIIEEEIPAEQLTTHVAPNIIIEGGEVIKIVRMKQEEIINCTCGITEEDGLMIQCELCLCWQHAYCNNIQRENEVPEKYVCYICQHPAKERASKKYYHDQDWLKLGNLPTGSYHCRDEEAVNKEFAKLKTSHDISGGLLELKNYLHSINLKIKIAGTKNHPKLYLWSKPWDKLCLPEKQEHESKPEIKIEIIPEEKPKDNSESLLFNILKSGKIKDQSTDFPKLDLNTLIENNLDQMNSPGGPQPLHPIESSDCKLNLLDNIAHCQSLVEERLNNFEKELNELDPTLIDDTTEDYSRVMNTTAMLVKDLKTLKELSKITTF